MDYEAALFAYYWWEKDDFPGGRPGWRLVGSNASPDPQRGGFGVVLSLWPGDDEPPADGYPRIRVKGEVPVTPQVGPVAQAGVPGGTGATVCDWLKRQGIVPQTWQCSWIFVGLGLALLVGVAGSRRGR